MLRLTSTLLLLVFVACGPPPAGTLTARLSADPALAMPLTTEDGWSLTFTHAVLAVSGVTVTGGGVTGVPALAKPKLIDLLKDAHFDLATNASAEPRSYDMLLLEVSRGSNDENVNADTTTLDRMGTRAMYFEGTATKQSTTRQFQLGLPAGAVYRCMPQVILVAQGTSIVDFRVSEQKLFFDDAGKLRFEAWALADTAPQDGIVLNAEASSVLTSSLPPGQYNATAGSLQTVLEKRRLTLVSPGDSGSCTGQ